MSSEHHSAPPANSDAADIEADPSGWHFDVPPDRFETHIRRSVPYYDDGHALIARLSDFFLPDDAQVYDVGCATGALARQLVARHPRRAFRYLGIDQQPAMVAHARGQVDDPRVDFVCDNALGFDYRRMHLAVCYYTLQFIHPSVRIELLRTLYERLHWGGALILFEKVRAPDARFQDLLSQVYLEHKIDAGFTPRQVLDKQRSLKGVLEPFSEDGNRVLLTEVGFRDIVPIFKWVCFTGWLVIK